MFGKRLGDRPQHFHLLGAVLELRKTSREFAARFELEIEPATLAAIKSSATLIRTVSAERIAEELVNIIKKKQ